MTIKDFLNMYNADNSQDVTFFVTEEWYSKPLDENLTDEECAGFYGDYEIIAWTCSSDNSIGFLI